MTTYALEHVSELSTVKLYPIDGWNFETVTSDCVCMCCMLPIAHVTTHMQIENCQQCTFPCRNPHTHTHTLCVSCQYCSMTPTKQPPPGATSTRWFSHVAGHSLPTHSVCIIAYVCIFVGEHKFETCRTSMDMFWCLLQASEKCCTLRRWKCRNIFAGNVVLYLCIFTPERSVQI